MTKKRRTRRALLNSVISLMLCFAMLLGTTFAWFTDTETSGINQIIAGNLDVELYHNGEEPIDGTTQLFLDKDGKSILWEPGVVAYENLTVKNVGNLALKYKLAINVAKENATTEGNYKLSDVLQYAVLENRTIASSETRADILAEAENAKTKGNLNAFSVEGTLEPGTETNNIAVVIFWNPNNDDIDNRYNLNNTKNGLLDNTVWPTTDKQPLHIDLGVNLYATQKMSENDSFGNDYDENADFGSSSNYVSAFEELKAAMLAGGNIVLKSDIFVDTDAMLTDLASIPVALGVVDGKDVVLDLNGYNITLPDTGDGTTAVIFTHDADLTITGEGTITQKGKSDYVLWAKGDSTVNIKGGIYYAAGSETTLLYASGNTAWDTNDDWATINVYDGTFLNEVASTDAQNYMNVMNHGVGRINLYGGVYDFDPDWMSTSWPNGTDDAEYITIADGYSSSKSGDSYYVLPNGTKFISNADELIALSNQSLEGTIVLTNDIDLNNQTVQAIGAAYGKELTVIGNGHTISNANIIAGTHNGMDNYGLFYAYTNSTLTISDLVVENAAVEATGDNYGAAVIVGYMDGGSNVTLDNVDVNNSSVKNAYDEAAVYVSYNTGTLTMSDCDSTKCSVEGETTAKTGAFVGHVNGTSELTTCSTDLDMNASNRIDGKLVVDGVAYFIPTTDEKLNTALMSTEKEVVVTLSNDLSLNVSDAYIKLGGAETETMTINGNGKTLTLSTTYWSRLNMANPDAKLIINDATVTSSQKSGTWNSYDVTFNCNVELNDVTLKKALALDNPGKTSVLNNVTIEENNGDYYALWIVAGGDVTIDGLDLVSTTGRGIKIDKQYVSNPGATTLRLSNATLETAKKAAIMVKSSADSKIILSNVDISKVAADTTNAVWVDSDSAACYNLVTVVGGTKVQE